MQITWFIVGEPWSLVPLFSFLQKPKEVVRPNRKDFYTRLSNTGSLVNLNTFFLFVFNGTPLRWVIDRWKDRLKRINRMEIKGLRIRGLRRSKIRRESFSYAQYRSIVLLLKADPDRRNCLVLVDGSFSWNLGYVWTCRHPCRWSNVASGSPVRWGCCRWIILLVLTRDTWKIHVKRIFILLLKYLSSIIYG